MTENKETINKFYIASGLVLVITSIILFVQGRVWWCKIGDYAIWSSDIWGSHNSQHIFDPYTFTHILHGVLYFWIISLIFRKKDFAWQFLLAITIASGWELLENSSLVINHYRTETLSLDYFGDSIINSIADIFSCGFGFWLTHKIKFWWSLIFFLIVEIFLLLWIKDSLIVNIIMLTYPIEAIKKWQIGQ